MLLDVGAGLSMLEFRYFSIIRVQRSPLAETTSIYWVPWTLSQPIGPLVIIGELLSNLTDIVIR